MEAIHEDNVARLVAVAPERERLSPDAHARITAALESEWTAATATRSAPGPGLRLVTIVATLAAVVLGIVLGAWALRGDPGSVPGDDETTAAANSTAGTGGTAARNVGGDGVDGSRDASNPDLAGPLGAQGAAGARTAAGSGVGESAAVLDPPSAGATGAFDPSDTISAVVTLGEDLLAVPESVTLWVRPVVPLPRVADAVAFDLEWAGESRSIERSLETALGPARAFGVSHVHVQAEAAGAAPAWRRVAIEDLGAGPVGLVLSSGRTLSGQVVDGETGAPLDGALVVAVDQVPLDALAIHPDASERIPEPMAVTDANGAFRLDQLAGDGAVTLRASRTGYAPSWLRVQASAAGFEPVALPLGPGATVTGVVERDDGTRWANAIVIVSRQDVDPTASARPVMTFGGTRTADDGTYVVEDLPPGTYVALHFGDATEATAGPIAFRQVDILSTESVEVNFLAPQGGAGISFAGTLRSADGAPLHDVALTLMRLEDGEALEDDWRATQSSAEGEFVFTDLAPSAYTLFAMTDSFRHMRAVWSGTIEAPAEADVRLPETGLEIHCVRAEGGAPVVGAWVILEAYDGARDHWVFAGRGPTVEVVDGAAVARFEGIGAGSYRATIMGAAEGLGGAAVSSIRIEPGPATVVPVRIPAGGTLGVRAVDSRTARPIAGLTVSVLDATGHAVPQRDSVRTGDDGSASLESVSFGTVTVEFRRGDELVHTESFSFLDGDSVCSALIPPR